jgi:hypothetical protein
VSNDPSEVAGFAHYCDRAEALMCVDQIVIRQIALCPGHNSAIRIEILPE